MQSCLRPQSTSPASYLSSANQVSFESSPLLQCVFPPTCISSSSRSEIPMPYCPHRNLQRSVSEHSPVSPLQSEYGSACSLGSQHFRRKPTGSSRGSLSSIEERQRQIIPPPEQPQTYAAPSNQTSFPARRVLELYPSQPQEFLGPQYTNFSPVSSNPYEWWEHHSSPQRPRANTSSYMTSPTSYSSYPPTDAFDSEAESGRAWPGSGSSAPAATSINMMQSPVAPTRAEGLPLGLSAPTCRSESNFRRQSEAVDEFTSPSDFALFVEATSSLSINANASSNWSSPSPRAYPTPLPPSRLLAPLPPLPYQQMRSHSSPATTDRHLARQPSRSQLIAEALTGLDHEDARMRAETGFRRLDEDEDDLTADNTDDDLPGYTQSQAEASARQRREAARRAQELDAAWSRARRRRG